MEYTILLHQNAKPHLIIIKGIKELVKRDLVRRGFLFIMESKLILEAGTLLINFGEPTTQGGVVKRVKNTLFSYYEAQFDDLARAVNKSFGNGDRGGYCKLSSRDYVLCIDAMTLFNLRDYVMQEGMKEGKVVPYEETEEGTEINWLGTE